MNQLLRGGMSRAFVSMYSLGNSLNPGQKEDEVHA